MARAALQGADRARDRGPAAGRRGRRPGLDRQSTRRRARGRRGRPGADCELARGHRRRRHDPAGRRAHPRQRDAAARASTWATSASWPRRSTTTSTSTIDAIVERRYTAEDRLTLDVTVYRDGELVTQHLRAERGQRREGRPRADARGGRRDRRPAAVPVGLRRRRVRHADRLHGLQLQRRRPGGLARGRGAADGADQRARALRPADGGRARPRCWRSRCSPAPRRRRAVVRRPPDRRPAARAPGSRYAAASSPVRLVRLHEAPFTDRLVAKFGLPVEGWRGASERRRRLARADA